jgi:hypothetical protein
MTPAPSRKKMEEIIANTLIMRISVNIFVAIMKTIAIVAIRVGDLPMK